MKEEKYMEELYYLVAQDSAKSTNMKGKGVITVVNALKKKCGCRITFSKQLEKDLGLEDNVQFGFPKNNAYIVIGKVLNEEMPKYTLKRLKKNSPSSRLVLYNKEVILQICERLGLDFDETISITFYGIEYEETDNGLIAKVWKDGEKDVQDGSY